MNLPCFVSEEVQSEGPASNGQRIGGGRQTSAADRLPQRNSILRGHFAAVPADQRGQYSRRRRFPQEPHRAIATQCIHTEGVERVELTDVVAIDRTATAVLNQSVVAESPNSDGGVVVEERGVERPADLAGTIGRDE